MKIVSIALCIGLAAPALFADTVLIALASPTESGSPGDQLDFQGTLTNQTGSTVFLNSDNENDNLPGSVVDLTPFFNGPASLGPFASTGQIDLFTLTIPGGASLNTYSGTFEVIGGAGSDSQDILGAASFSVVVQPVSSVPEPRALGMVAIALLLLFRALRKQSTLAKRS